MTCEEDNKPDLFKDFLEQWNIFVGMVIGYGMASGLNLEPCTDGETLYLGNADNSTISSKIKRDQIPHCGVLIDFVRDSIKNIEMWNHVSWKPIGDDAIFIRKEDE